MCCIITGLEVLIGTDERFRKYKNDLFSHRSKELDRETMVPEQNKQLNVSIASYLKLLSGYFLIPSALKTLEYLIRRHKWVSSLFDFDNSRLFQQCVMICFLPRGIDHILPLLFIFLWFLISFFLFFRIHVHNNEDLILCALPYHDTHPFVRVVQILDTRLERRDYVFLVWLCCCDVYYWLEWLLMFL